MNKVNLTIYFADESKPDSVLLDIAFEEALVLIELHKEVMVACQIEKIKEKEVNNE